MAPRRRALPRPARPDGQAESVVSGSRRAQRDQGSAEGDDRVQVFDRLMPRSQRPGFIKWPDGVMPPGLCFVDSHVRRNGAAHPIHDARPDVRLYRGRSPCVLPCADPCTNGRTNMAESVYKVIELIGTSKDSWEKAAAAAVSRAGELLREICASPRSSSWTCNWTPAARSKPTAPSSASRSSSRISYNLEPSLRAKRSNPSLLVATHGLLRLRSQ